LSHFVEQRTLVSDLTKDGSLNYAALATLTEGYAALDLKDLVSRAVQSAAERSLVDANGRPDYMAVRVSLGSRVPVALIPFSQPKLMYQDFTTAQEGFVPLSLRDANLQKSTTSWTDVGGSFSRLEWRSGLIDQCDTSRAERNEESPQGDTGMANKICSHLHPITFASPFWVSSTILMVTRLIPSPVCCCTGTLVAERPCLPPRWQRSVASILSASRALKF